MRFFSSQFFFALRHCNNANNSKWLVRKERSFECKKKKYKRNELVKKPTYCQTHIHICKEHIALDKNRSTSRMCLSGERKREKKSSETSHFCCGCEKLTFLMASNGVECTDNLFEWVRRSRKYENTCISNIDTIAIFFDKDPLNVPKHWLLNFPMKITLTPDCCISDIIIFLLSIGYFRSFVGSFISLHRIKIWWEIYPFGTMNISLVNGLALVII